MDSQEQKIEQILRGQTDIKKDVREMRTALVGNELGNKGLVTRVNDVEKYQYKDKKQKWMIGGGLAVFGLLVKFWDKLFG